MDYEKKYKEALEDMRVIYPNLKGDAKLAVEHAFPELRESEDERIRKLLVEKISNLACGCFISQEQKQKFIHYLEKQKEQKPADLPPGFYFIDLDGNRYYSKEFRYGDMKDKVRVIIEKKLK